MGWGASGGHVTSTKMAAKMANITTLLDLEFYSNLDIVQKRQKWFFFSSKDM